MDRGDHPGLDGQMAVQAVEYRHHAVGGARRGGHDAVLAAELLLVDTVDDGGIDIRPGGLGEQHPAGAGDKVFFRQRALVEGAGALQHDIDIRPAQIIEIGHMADGDGLTVDHQFVTRRRHLVGKAAVGGVVAGQVADGVDIRQFVDGDHPEPRGQAALVDRPEQRAPDPAEAVDGETRHQPSNACTRATTLSSVKPKYLNSSPAGAEAPNVVMPTTSPSRPTYLRQKSAWAASTATRARTAGGSTLSRYSRSWASNSSVQGMETTRTRRPAAAS